MSLNEIMTPVLDGIRDERLRLIAERARESAQLRSDMLEALHEARLQIEYLHEKFQVTGSGETTLAKIRSAIARADGGGKDV